MRPKVHFLGKEEVHGFDSRQQLHFYPLLKLSGIIRVATQNLKHHDANLRYKSRKNRAMRFFNKNAF